MYRKGYNQDAPFPYGTSIYHQPMGTGFVSIYSRIGRFITPTCSLGGTLQSTSPPVFPRNPRQCLMCSEISLCLLGPLGGSCFARVSCVTSWSLPPLPGVLNIRLQELSDAKWESMAFSAS